MSSLAGKTIRGSYADLLQVSNSNQGVDATIRPVEDGEGTSTPLQLSSSKVKIDGDIEVTGEAFGLGQLKWQGVYNTAVEYNIDDVVSYNGSSYICTTSSVGNIPTDVNYWDELARAGAAGVDGVDGADGSDGASGATGAGVSDASINGAGRLLLALDNGSVIDCGKVTGEDGAAGSDATFTLTPAGSLLGGIRTSYITSVGTTITGDLDVDSTTGIATLKDSAKPVAGIAIVTGTIVNGQQIPLPSGYTQSECKWIVAVGRVSSTHGDHNAGHDLNFYTDGNRNVTTTGIGVGNGTANFMIIGVK